MKQALTQVESSIDKVLDIKTNTVTQNSVTPRADPVPQELPEVVETVETEESTEPEAYGALRQTLTHREKQLLQSQTLISELTAQLNSLQSQDTFHELTSLREEGMFPHTLLMTRRETGCREWETECPGQTVETIIYDQHGTKQFALARS